MNLYLLSQDANQDYDTYDSCVVVANDEEDARRIHPENREFDPDATQTGRWINSWAYKLSDIQVKLIGTAIDGLERGVVCASFNAG